MVSFIPMRSKLQRRQREITVSGIFSGFVVARTKTTWLTWHARHPTRINTTVEWCAHLHHHRLQHRYLAACCSIRPRIVSIGILHRTSKKAFARSDWQSLKSTPRSMAPHGVHTCPSDLSGTPCALAVSSSSSSSSSLCPKPLSSAHFYVVARQRETPCKSKVSAGGSTVSE